MLNNLLVMQVFVKTAERGSFAAAGAALGMSAQMAGKYVAALEKRLAVRLLNRSTHNQSLTEAGRVYLQGCIRTIAEAQAAEASVAVIGNLPKGTLRISAPLGVGTAILIPRLKAFLRQYPEIRIELSLSDDISNLIEDGFDAAIRIGHLPDSRLISRTLAPYPIITCASPAYLQEHGTPTAPGDVATHECIDYVFPVFPAPRLWCFSVDGGTVEIKPMCRLTVNDGRALVEAALSGLGIIQVGKLKVEEHLRSGRLVQLLQQHECAARPLQVVFASRQMQTPKLRIFIDWLIAAFQTPGV